MDQDRVDIASAASRLLFSYQHGTARTEPVSTKDAVAMNAERFELLLAVEKGIRSDGLADTLRRGLYIDLLRHLSDGVHAGSDSIQ